MAAEGIGNALLDLVELAEAEGLDEAEVTFLVILLREWHRAEEALTRELQAWVRRRLKQWVALALVPKARRGGKTLHEYLAEEADNEFAQAFAELWAAFTMDPENRDLGEYMRARWVSLMKRKLASPLQKHRRAKAVFAKFLKEEVWQGRNRFGIPGLLPALRDSPYQTFKAILEGYGFTLR